MVKKVKYLCYSTNSPQNFFNFTFIFKLPFTYNLFFGHWISLLSSFHFPKFYLKFLFLLAFWYVDLLLYFIYLCSLFNFLLRRFPPSKLILLLTRFHTTIPKHLLPLLKLMSCNSLFSYSFLTLFLFLILYILQCFLLIINQNS